MILCLLGNTCVARSTVQSESNRMEQLVGEVRESSNSRISKGPAHERLGQRSLSDGTEAKDGHLAVHDGRLVLWHRSTQSVYYTPTKVRVIMTINPRAYRNRKMHSASGKVGQQSGLPRQMFLFGLSHQALAQFACLLVEDAWRMR